MISRGPWRAFEQGSRDGYSRFRVIEDSRGITVARVPVQAQADDDVRVLAAAPELLRELEAVMAHQGGADCACGPEEKDAGTCPAVRYPFSRCPADHTSLIEVYPRQLKYGTSNSLHTPSITPIKASFSIQTSTRTV